jgi:hypothetical protein
MLRPRSAGGEWPVVMVASACRPSLLADLSAGSRRLSEIYDDHLLPVITAPNGPEGRLFRVRQACFHFRKRCTLPDAPTLARSCRQRMGALVALVVHGKDSEHRVKFELCFGHKLAPYG